MNKSPSRSPLLMEDRQEAVGPSERLPRSPLMMGDYVEPMMPGGAMMISAGMRDGRCQR